MPVFQGAPVVHSLRSRVIKLAYDEPSLRHSLLPMLAEDGKMPERLQRLFDKYGMLGLWDRVQSVQNQMRKTRNRAEHDEMERNYSEVYWDYADVHKHIHGEFPKDGALPPRPSRTPRMIPVSRRRSAAPAEMTELLSREDLGRALASRSPIYRGTWKETPGRATWEKGKEYVTNEDPSLTLTVASDREYPRSSGRLRDTSKSRLVMSALLRMDGRVVGDLSKVVVGEDPVKEAAGRRAFSKLVDVIFGTPV